MTIPLDVITVGAAIQDVYIHSGDFRTEETADQTSEACFLLGGKLEISAPVISSGGGATNSAATFAHLGFRVATIAKIGRDLPGRMIEQDLAHHGVHTNALIRSATEQTGYAVLLTTPSGQRTALVYRGASETLKEAEIDFSHVRASFLYVTSLGGNMPLLRRLFDHAILHNMRIAWNPGGRELTYSLTERTSFAKHVDVLMLNREEAAAWYQTRDTTPRDLLRRFSQDLRGITVLTDGGNGTYAVQNGTAFHATPSSVSFVNTTGSGDAMGAGFVAGILRYNNIVNALQLGTLNAESVIQKVGAKEGLLDRLPGTRRLGSIQVKPYTIA